MSTSDRSELSSLTNTEIKSLNERLQEIDKRFDVAMVQGLLTASIVGPDISIARIAVLSSLAQLFLSTSLGETRDIESIEKAEKTFSLILCLENRIVADLRQGTYKLLRIDGGGPNDDQRERVASWCRGFLDGMSMLPEYWTRFAEDEENSKMLLPLIHFSVSEVDPEAPIEEVFTPAQMVFYLEGLPAFCLTYWHSKAATNAPQEGNQEAAPKSMDDNKRETSVPRSMPRQIWG
jgi:yecA family protein